MRTQSHRDLKVWQRAIELVTSIYRVSQQLPREELYGLTALLRRAAISVPANIAEGNARSSRRDYAHFLSIARASLMEVETLLVITARLGYAGEEMLNPLLGEIDELSRMLYSLRQNLAAAKTAQT